MTWARPLVREDLHPQLAAACNHLLSPGGKGFRAELVRASAEACGNRGRQAAVEAVTDAVELLHAFTLVHDDIMDRSMKRRGRSATHIRYGEPMAILAGDLLYTLAIEKLLSPAIESADQARLLRRLVSTLTHVANGQAADISGGAWPTPEEAEEIAREKTGRLFAFACHAGGTAGNASVDQCVALADFGLHLGTAYQLQDDLLDLVGDERMLGKAPGADLRSKRRTYPLATLVALAPSERDWLQHLFLSSVDGGPEYQRLQLLCHRTGTARMTWDHANDLYDTALLALDPVVPRESFIPFVDKLRSRVPAGLVAPRP